MKHCDDYIDDPIAPEALRKFLSWARLPAHGMLEPRPWPMLFATHDGKRVRVTMASRFGEVGITSKLDRESGYEQCIEVADLTDFSDTPPQVDGTPMQNHKSPCCDAKIGASLGDGVLLGSCQACSVLVCRRNPRSGIVEWLDGANPWTTESLRPMLAEPEKRTVELWLYYERDGRPVDRMLVGSAWVLTDAAALYERERATLRRMQLGEWHWRRPEAQPGMLARRPVPGMGLAMVLGILALDDDIPPPPKRRS